MHQGTFQIIFIDDDLVRFALGDADRRLAADRADGALKRTHARLHRVPVDDRRKRAVRKSDLPLFKPVLLALFRDKITFCDLLFLVGRVSRKLNDLHSVAQGSGNGVQRICRCDEHDLGKIVGNFQVSVAERCVLFRIEHL